MNEVIDFWCKCGNPSEDVIIHEDEHGCIDWVECDDCGKCLQVG